MWSVLNGSPETKFISVKSVSSADTTGVYRSVFTLAKDSVQMVHPSTWGRKMQWLPDVSGQGDFLVDIHCWAHNLELGARDARNEGTNNIFTKINDFFHQIFKIFHYSPKARPHVKLVATILDIKVFLPELIDYDLSTISPCHIMPPQLV